MWNLINKMNKQNRNRLIDTGYRLTAVRQVVVRGLDEIGGKKPLKTQRYRQKYAFRGKGDGNS